MHPTKRMIHQYNILGFIEYIDKALFDFEPKNKYACKKNMPFSGILFLKYEYLKQTQENILKLINYFHEKNMVFGFEKNLEIDKYTMTLSQYCPCYT